MVLFYSMQKVDLFISGTILYTHSSLPDISHSEPNKADKWNTIMEKKYLCQCCHVAAETKK